MPGAGFFEAAAAAASVSLSVANIVTSFSDVTIPAPLLLQHNTRALLETAVDCLTGRLEVSSQTAKHKQIHCRGIICQVISGQPSAKVCKLEYLCIQ